jgi:trypsin-like peptidase
MAGEDWATGVEAVRPHVVRISTPWSQGTGFLVSNGKANSFCVIATAAHVVARADDWQEPIHVCHVSSGKAVVLGWGDRFARIDLERDTAAILFHRGNIPFPAAPLRLAPEGLFLKTGYELGWLGFPAVPTADICFFSGRVSAWDPGGRRYFVDGVAMNGVSGGPAFYLSGQNASDIDIVGVVSAYFANRATGEALPGLSVVSDVSQFHELAAEFDSLEQARSSVPAKTQNPPIL